MPLFHDGQSSFATVTRDWSTGSVRQKLVRRITAFPFCCFHRFMSAEPPVFVVVPHNAEHMRQIRFSRLSEFSRVSPCLYPLLDPVVDEHKARQRVSPPPAKQAIQDQPHEHGRCEIAVNEGDPCFGGDHRITKLPTDYEFAQASSSMAITVMISQRVPDRDGAG
jgi:hypothetical protein